LPPSSATGATWRCVVRSDNAAGRSGSERPAHTNAARLNMNRSRTRPVRRCRAPNNSDSGQKASPPSWLATCCKLSHVRPWPSCFFDEAMVAAVSPTLSSCQTLARCLQVSAVELFLSLRSNWASLRRSAARRVAAMWARHGYCWLQTYRSITILGLRGSQCRHQNTASMKVSPHGSRRMARYGFCLATEALPWLWRTYNP